MGYQFKARLCGYFCEECLESLADVKVRIYRLSEALQKPEAPVKVGALVEARPKYTTAVLPADVVKQKEALLLAEATTNENGEFVLDLDEKQYKGEPFEVDVYVERAPKQKDTARKHAPVQFTITTLQPEWKRSEGNERDYFAAWEYCLPSRFWCFIRGLFDAWVICGTVKVCQTKTPVHNLRVRAYDSDKITDDFLGQDVTDINGHFRIDYTSADFKQTFLSPWINVETPFGSPIGPDVYFKVETLSGTVLINETRPVGFQPGRTNIGPCFCIDLCVDTPPDGHVDTIPLFESVGAYSVQPADNHFTAAGLTTSGNYAFTDTLPLIGILPDGQNSQPLEYHFRIAEWNAALTVLGAFSDVTAGMIAPTRIGSLEYFDWDPVTSTWSVTSDPYYANNPGVAPITIHRPPALGGDLVVTLNKPVKPGGWIEVPTENQLTPGGIGRFIPVTGTLINLDTTTLMNESYDLRTPAPGLAAGQSVPSASKTRGRTFQLLFEARQVNPPNTIVGSNSLNKITICNVRYTYTRHTNWAGGDVTTRGVVSLNIQQLLGAAGGCGTITDTVTALYTGYHPFAGSGSVYFEGNSPIPSPLALSFVGGEAVSPAGGHAFPFVTPSPCAYILWLQVTLNLTSGYGLISDATNWDHIAFCKE
jgi:hypothetical protein